MSACRKDLHHDDSGDHDMRWVSLAEVSRGIDLAVLRARDRVSSAARTFATSARLRLVRRRLRGPGEPVPPVGLAAYYDYRDILQVDYVPPTYRDGAFRLGDAFDVRLGHRGRIAIPPEAMLKHVAIVGPRLHETRRQLLAPWIAAALERGWSTLAIDADGRLSDLVEVEIAESALGRGATRNRIDRTRPDESVNWNWLEEADNSTIEPAISAVLGVAEDARRLGPAHDSRVLRGMLELVRDRAIEPEAEALIAAMTSQHRFLEIARRDRHSDGGARLHDLSTVSEPSFRRTVSGARSRVRRLERRLAPLHRRPRFGLHQILSTPHLLTLAARSRDGEGGRALAGLLVSMLVERALLRSPGGVTNLVVVVEDVRVLIDRVGLAELLEIGSTAGVAFVLCSPSTGAYRLLDADVLDRCGTLITIAGCSSLSARFMSDRISRSGHSLGVPEISKPPFAGRMATVHSDAIAERPFLVDLSA